MIMIRAAIEKWDFPGMIAISENITVSWFHAVIHNNLNYFLKLQWPLMEWKQNSFFLKLEILLFLITKITIQHDNCQLSYCVIPWKQGINATLLMMRWYAMFLNQGLTFIRNDICIYVNLLFPSQIRAMFTVNGKWRLLWSKVVYLDVNLAFCSYAKLITVIWNKVNFILVPFIHLG